MDSEIPSVEPWPAPRAIHADAPRQAQGLEPLRLFPAFEQREPSRPIPQQPEPRQALPPAQQRVFPASGPARLASSPALPDQAVAGFVPRQRLLQIPSLRGTPVVGARFPPLPISWLFTRGEELIRGEIWNQTPPACFSKSRLKCREPFVTLECAEEWSVFYASRLDCQNLLSRVCHVRPPGSSIQSYLRIPIAHSRSILANRASSRTPS